MHWLQGKRDTRFFVVILKVQYFLINLRLGRGLREIALLFLCTWASA